MNNPSFTVIIPAYNEAENLPQLLSEIDAAVSGLNNKCEIIFVNDGSNDETLMVMRDLQRTYAKYGIRIINLNGNYGLSTALDAGFQAAATDIVVSIDSDLQNDPADIPVLLKHLEEYDVAVGIRTKRQDSAVKKLSSRIANNFRNYLLQENWRDTGCTLKAYKRQFIQKIRLSKGMHRFLPTLLLMENARVTEVPVNHRPRIHGKSKYGLTNRLIGPFTDLLAVRWMKKRKVLYRTEELTHEQ